MTLADPSNIHPGKAAGAIHVHPMGQFVYVTNRNSGVVDFAGTKVSNGGENNVAVFAINQDTGKPKLLQYGETHAIHFFIPAVTQGKSPPPQENFQDVCPGAEKQSHWTTYILKSPQRGQVAFDVVVV